MAKCILITVKDPYTGRKIKTFNIGKKEFDRYIKTSKDNNDLGTDNLGKLLKGLFTCSAVQSYIYDTMVDITGTGQTVYSQHYASTPAYFFNNTYSGLDRTIKVGTGSTPPTVSDYNLKGEIIGSCNVTVYWESGRPYVDLTGTFSWTTDVTVYEIGLFFDVFTPNYKKTLMLDRTVVSGGIAVPANRILTITYRLAI